MKALIRQIRAHCSQLRHLLRVEFRRRGSEVVGYLGVQSRKRVQVRWLALLGGPDVCDLCMCSGLGYCEGMHRPRVDWFISDSATPGRPCVSLPPLARCPLAVHSAGDAEGVALSSQARLPLLFHLPPTCMSTHLWLLRFRMTLAGDGPQLFELLLGVSSGF